MSASPPAAVATETVVEAQGLTKIYRVPRGLFKTPGQLRAVDDLSFRLERGRTLAVVGESGCGKSTLARMVMLIDQPTAGSLTLVGQQMATATSRQIKGMRRHAQMVFQNPYGSLNPRQKVGTILQEPLVINTDLKRAERIATARAMMAKVGLRPEHFDRYPHMFSGGQRQRLAIARALMLRPELVVADEPVAALDVSIQAQVLNLLMDLQEEFRLAYLFISHGLSVVRHIADEVLVMYLGRAVEQGPKTEVFAQPLHPYTRALMASTPFVEPALRAKRIPLTGELPSALNPPAGCGFHPRCPFATDQCRMERPNLRSVGRQKVACHHAERIG